MTSSLPKPVILRARAVTGEQQCRCDIALEKRICEKIHCVATNLFLSNLGLCIGTKLHSTFSVLLQILVMDE